MTIKELYEWALANNAEDLTLMSMDCMYAEPEAVEFHDVETDDYDGHKYVVVY
ncbi:hypothetical protein [Phascolarctobacterium succinatutens]|uniref:hypothetical protein n=1 Tax=Phascolarctobacterium succinatutens TaxID=626940 RepID=UPI003077F101